SYLLLLFLPSYLVLLLGGALGTPARLALMLLPGAMALLMRRITGWGGWQGAGLRHGKLHYYVWAWFIPVAVTGLSFGLALLPGWGAWQLPPLADGSRSAELSFLAEAVAGLTILLVPGLVLGLGEELGWRGYLLPRLWHLGPWLAFILVGLIWWLWHWSLGILPFGDYRISILAILLGIVNATLLGIVLAWLYSASGSIITPALAYMAYQNSATVSRAVNVSPYIIASLTALILAGIVLALALRGEIRRMELKS
ncbi:MAG: CPBP family intramembrane metalloprotease, partial [Chloroflexota bacterium]|nr:CPBP family intramembrane metalloprotease [Chloroflexota bacterium]